MTINLDTLKALVTEKRLSGVGGGRRQLVTLMGQLNCVNDHQLVLLLAEEVIRMKETSITFKTVGVGSDGVKSESDGQPWFPFKD